MSTPVPSPSPDGDDIPLDERIALLTEMQAAPPDGIDVPELTGMLGCAWLEVHERDGDPDALAAGLARLHEAIAAAPGHEDRAQWCFSLGMGYGTRAELHGTTGDYDRAIEWFSTLRTELPADDEVPADDSSRDDIALILIELHWDRFWLLRYGPDRDPSYALAESERLVADLAALPVSEQDPQAARYARMMVGLSHLERYDLSEQRLDLDHGIGLLAAAVPELPADTPRLGYASAELARAYRLRAVLDDDPVSVDLSLATGDAALDRTSPDETAVWPMLHGNQAFGYEMRWRSAGDPTDLDRAIAGFRVNIDGYGEDEVSAWVAATCGGLLCERAELLRERGELAGAAADLTDAVTLLEPATHTPDDADAGVRWYELGRAHHAQWRLTEAPVSLEAAGRCLDRAVQFGVPDDYTLLCVHTERLFVGADMFIRDCGQPHTAAWSASAARFRVLLAEGRAALDRGIAADLDLRSLLALPLGYYEMLATDDDFGTFDTNRVLGLLSLAGRIRHPPEGWQTFLDVANGIWKFTTDSERLGAGVDLGISDLVHALVSGSADDGWRDMLREVVPIAVMLRAMVSGDIRGLLAAEGMRRHPAVTRQPGATDPQLALDADLQTTIIAAMHRARSGDLGSLAELGQRVEEQLSATPPSVVNELAADLQVHVLRQLAAVASGRPVQPLDMASALAAPRGVAGYEPLARSLFTAVVQAFDAVARNDLALLRSAAAQADQLADRMPPDRLRRLAGSTGAGLAFLQLARLDRFDGRAARRAVHWFTEAVELAPGPEHPQWPLLALGLAEASRLVADPDRARSRALGMSALRGHARQVLLQAGTDYAIEAARADWATAAMVAGWCLNDRAYDEAVAALDAGRGLVLHAATTSREIADRLADRGYADLAAQWRATAGLGRDQIRGDALVGVAGAVEVPDNLRGRVLTALGGAANAAEIILFEPIRVDEIQAGLAAVGADALVYLVPSAPSGKGVAVVVPVSGAVDVLWLAGLWAGQGSLVGRYAGTGEGAGGAARDAGPVTPSSAQPGPALPSPAQLDELCRWAWSAGMAQLLEHVGRWHLHRPARLVLVPTGTLSLVPWHAAYTESGTGRRYAVHDAVFSYSPSARMLCTAARHPVRPIRSALVVGNPGGDLTFAGVEARAIHRAFYPTGSYLGQPTAGADGKGTPEEVLDWIARAAPGPSMLHFACHGRVDPSRPADARLLLADKALAARELLEASRLAELVIDRVFLAACTTHLTGQDYDETVSLATAFLAAGAQTVFGSLWPVPDADTSLLMFMVHHHLNVEARSPAEALHAAQLWMLDPGRQAPAGMPDELREFCGRASAADLVSWAGFTHLGR